MDDAKGTIRVLVADDFPVTRSGIRAILEKEPDIKVVGEAEDGLEAERMVSELRPDILLLDLVMPSFARTRSRDGCARTIPRRLPWC